MFQQVEEDRTIDEEGIDVRRYIGIFLGHWWPILLLPAIGAAAGLLYSNRQEPAYQATASILVQDRGGGFIPASSDFRRSDELADTYRRLITTKPFLDRVQQSPDLPPTMGGLASRVSATKATRPPIINVTVRHEDPVVAAQAAQLVAEEFVDYTIEQRLAEIARLQAAAAAQGITNVEALMAAQFTAVDSLSILESVSVPGSPFVPRTRLNITIGVLLGLFLASVASLILDNLRDTVRSPEQLFRRFGVTSLGTLFRWSSQEVGPGDLVMLKSPRSSYAESFRQIRANLQFATAANDARIIMVSSPGPGEGKTTIVCNLAIALAQAGKRVVLVDADLRRPSVHRMFEDTEPGTGLTNVLAGMGVEMDDIIQQTKMDGVFVIPCGPIPPNPAELLSSPKMKLSLEELARQFDIVLVDSPPLLLVADGSVLAAQVDLVVVVVDGFGTRSSALRASLEALQVTQVSNIGVIINKLKRARFGYGYGYPYYYQYSNYKYYEDGEHALENGAGGLYQRVTGKAKSVWQRVRRS